MLVNFDPRGSIYKMGDWFV